MCVYIWIEPDGKWMEGGGINYCHSRIPMVCLVANTAIRHRTRPTSYPTSSWPCSTPTVPVGRNATTTASIHLPPPPPPPHWGVYIYPAYHGPVICHWITLIKRFSPSVGCRARSFIDASAIPWISLRSTREGRRGGVGWGKPEIAIRTDTSYWQLSSRWPVCCAGLCYNRGWEQSALEICRTWGGKGGGGERNDPRLIRGKLFEFSDWWITISMV